MSADALRLDPHHTYPCAVAGCTARADCDCEYLIYANRFHACDPTRDYLCVDHADYHRCGWCGSYVPTVRRVGFDAFCAACNDPAEAARQLMGQRILRRGAAYIAEMQALTVASIGAGDAEDAASFATRAAHEVGYLAWVQAKLDGRPVLAPMSNRLPADRTDFTRARVAPSEGAL